MGNLAIVVTLVFVVLKLTGVIAWSWWLVCLPLIVFIPAVMVLAVLLVGILAAAVIKGLELILGAE